MVISTNLSLGVFFHKSKSKLGGSLTAQDDNRVLDDVGFSLSAS